MLIQHRRFFPSFKPSCGLVLQFQKIMSYPKFQVLSPVRYFIISKDDLSTAQTVWYGPNFLHKAVTGESVSSTWGFLFLQHYVILLKPCETLSTFGAFFIFRFLALDDEQALEATGCYNKATENQVSFCLNLLLGLKNVGIQVWL